MRLQLLTLDHLVQLIDPKLYLHLQKADSTNFFFFFRMLLVWYKREFEWMDVLRLWETLWTDYLSSNFHLFIALAILEKHRDVILQHLQHFDEVLKYGMYSHLYPSSISSLSPSFPHTFAKAITGSMKMKLTKPSSPSSVNELSNTIDLPSTLIRAESLFRRFQRTVEAIDRKHNFPAPSLRQRKPQLPTPEPVKDTATASGATTGPDEGAGRAAKPATTVPAGNKGKQTQGQSVGAAVAQGVGAEKEEVISTELRALLSREVQKLDKKEVREHGGGVGT